MTTSILAAQDPNDSDSEPRCLPCASRVWVEPFPLTEDDLEAFTTYGASPVDCAGCGIRLLDAVYDDGQP